MDRAIIALLRGERNCRPVQLGRLHLYHFWKHQPQRGLINVPWVKDLRAKQFAMSGYISTYLQEAQRYLITDAHKFSTSNAFIAPTETFANEVMRWYNAPRPWIQFANYPDKIKIGGGKRRNEILYLDSSSTVFQEEFFQRLFAFFDELYTLTGTTGVVVANIMKDKIAALPHRRHIKVLGMRGEYDCRSQFGLLCNLTNFQQAAECLPRKLLFYLHCGMIPIIHATFMESVFYLQRHDIPAWTYYSTEEAAANIENAAQWPGYNRQHFCIQERINDLLTELQRIGGQR